MQLIPKVVGIRTQVLLFAEQALSQLRFHAITAKWSLEFPEGYSKHFGREVELLPVVSGSVPNHWLLYISLQ